MKQTIIRAAARGQRLSLLESDNDNARDTKCEQYELCKTVHGTGVLCAMACNTFPRVVSNRLIGSEQFSQAITCITPGFV